MHAGALIAYAVSLYVLELIVVYFKDTYQLRQFPEYPRFAGLSDLSYITHNAFLAPKFTRTEDLHAAHQRLGPILRLGPTRLSFASPEAARDIYGTGTSLKKGDLYETPGGTKNLLTVTDKAEHRVKRKRLSAAFTSSHLVQWEHKIADNVERLLAQMDQRQGETVDFRTWSNLFTLDAILDIALSCRMGLTEATDDTVEAESARGKKRIVSMRGSLQAVNRTLSPIVWAQFEFPALKLLTKLWPGYQRQWKLAESWPDVVRSLVRRRAARDDTGEGFDDLFACLVQDAKGQKLSLPESELLAETSHLLDAGSDTTSIALTHVMYCLARQPVALSKLREELDVALPAVQIVPSYKQVSSLPYLRACIDEAMRLRPALSAGLQRVIPAGGAIIAGMHVAEGVNVSVAAHILHRNPRLVGPLPDDFQPERWLGDEEAARRLQRNSLTFSMGGRVCIGKNITYMEQTMLVAALVRRYDFALPTPDWQMQWEEFFNLWPTELPLVLRRRR